MDQPLSFPESPGPDAGVGSGAESGAESGGLAAMVAAMAGDPRVWFARGLIETDGLDAPAGSALGMEIEDVAERVLASDPAAGGRLSRHDAVAFVQAVTRQMSRLEAVRSLVMTMLTHDGAYHDCDTEWSGDDGTGRACVACSESRDLEHTSAGETVARGGSQNASPVGQVGMEVSAALGVSPTLGTAMVDRAVDQVTDLPETWARMADGTIDGYKARIIAAGTRPLIENLDVSLPPAERAAERARRERLRVSVQRRVLPTAAAKTGEQLRRQVRRLVLRADPDTARVARAVGTAGRQVSRPYAGDGGPVGTGGIGAMTLRGPVEDLEVLYRALDAAARHARTEQADPRTLDQLRFDIITAIGWSALRSGRLGCHTAANHAASDDGASDDAASDDGASNDGASDAGCGVRMVATVGRRPVEIRVTVSLATLLGLDEDPADLDGVGPIPAGVALDLAFGDDATWRRLVTDPLTGALLDYGHRTYRPPAAVDSYVRTRDGTCRFPTTLTTADTADLDHTTPFDHADVHPCPGQSCDQPDGRTAAENLGVLSRRAHTARTHHHWQLEQPTPGTFRWTSPAGHTYTVDPDPLTEPETITTPTTDDTPPF